VRPLAALVALGLGLAALPAAAQELGRLFLTPEQRATLDARRKARVPDEAAAVPIVVAPTTRVDGYVQRSGGKSTVWVNGEPVREGARAAGARIVPAKPGATRIVIGAPEDAREAQVRVGQSVDTASGEVRDPLGDGEIRVRRPAEKSAKGK